MRQTGLNVFSLPVQFYRRGRLIKKNLNQDLTLSLHLTGSLQIRKILGYETLIDDSHKQTDLCVCLCDSRQSTTQHLTETHHSADGAADSVGLELTIEATGHLVNLQGTEHTG